MAGRSYQTWLSAAGQVFRSPNANISYDSVTVSRVSIGSTDKRLASQNGCVF